MFQTFQVQLACQACQDAGKAASCVHMLHLVPRWQSSDKHERLHCIMADRPDLILSELRCAYKQISAVCAYANTPPSGDALP